jgi:hypothetical protein
MAPGRLHASGAVLSTDAIALGGLAAAGFLMLALLARGTPRGWGWWYLAVAAALWAGAVVLLWTEA